MQSLFVLLLNLQISPRLRIYIEIEIPDTIQHGFFVLKVTLNMHPKTDQTLETNQINYLERPKVYTKH